MAYYVNKPMLTHIYYRRDNKNMDDNMNNKDLENENLNNNENEEENGGVAFGSSEYYKKLYEDFPEDVAEMLIGTHPLMKKDVSDELTHSIKIKSAREINRRAVDADEAVEEMPEESPVQEEFYEKPVSASKDPVEDIHDDEDVDSYVGDLTNFTKGLISSPKKHKEEVQEEAPVQEEKSEDDITAEQVAKMLGGIDVEPVDDDELEQFEEEPVEEPKEKPRKKARKEGEPAKERPRKKRRHYDEKELELSNIDKQANLNELFREDDDYYEEKHSGNGVIRIVIAVVAVVVLAFFIYKVASLAGQVTKLNEQVESYKTMESEYEQLKLDNLSLTEQVESLQAQLGGGSTDNSSDNNNSGDTSSQTSSNTSTPASTTSGSKTYTVQSGDTYWSIATKVYGNGSYYEKILKANNLTENDKLREGMTLTIPAA